MKGQISRYTYDRAKQYSAVYQVQGGMVTDADLGEASTIARERVNELGQAAIGTGVPKADGVIGFDAAGLPFLRSGYVHADGIRAFIGMEGSGLDGYARQANYPSPPPVPAGRVLFYADIWERPVAPWQDPTLADPGLLGSETSFRSQTVGQIRWKLSDGPDTELHLSRKGTGELHIAENPDPLGQPAGRVGNALFRLEVVRIEGSVLNPTKVCLAWSTDNGGRMIQPELDVPADFADGPAAFEYFNDTTELHVGGLPQDAARQYSKFDAVFRADGGKYVRKWDGYAEITFGGAIATVPEALQPNIKDNNRWIRLRTDLADLELNLEEARVLPGDYWLAEVRQHAAEKDRVRILNGGEAVGIDHHYCILFEYNNGTAVKLTDEQKLARFFSSLGNMDASDIGFAAEPKMADGSVNVQQVLSELQKRKPADGPGDIGLEHILDWGVLTGLDLTDDGRGVIVAPGTFLTRGGKFGRFVGGRVDDLPGLIPEAERNAAILRGSFECAIGLNFDPATNTARIGAMPEADAFGPPDPGVREILETARQGFVDIKNLPIYHFDHLDQSMFELMKKASAAVLIKEPPETLGSLPLSEQQFEFVERQFMNSFDTPGLFVPDIRANLRTDFDRIKDAIMAWQGDRNLVRGRIITEWYRYFGRWNKERLRAAIRAAAVVPPVPGLDAPHRFVPLGRVALTHAVQTNVWSVADSTITRGRKQAITPRAMRYRMGGGNWDDYFDFEDYFDGRADFEALKQGLTGFHRVDTFLDLAGVIEPGDWVPPIFTPLPHPDPPFDPFPDFPGPILVPKPKPPRPPGPRPPIDWRKIPFRWDPTQPTLGPGIEFLAQGRKVTATTIEQARDALAGQGATAKIINLDNADALDELASQVPADLLQQQLTSGVSVDVGDSVAVLTRGGKVAGLALLNQAPRDFRLAPTQSALAQAFVTNEIAETLRETKTGGRALQSDIVRLQAEYGELLGSRDALQANIEELKANVGTLEATVTRLDTNRSTALEQLELVRTQHDALTNSLNSQLQALTDRQKLVTDDFDLKLKDFRSQQETIVKELTTAVLKRRVVTEDVIGDAVLFQEMTANNGPIIASDFIDRNVQQIVDARLAPNLQQAEVLRNRVLAKITEWGGT